MDRHPQPYLLWNFMSAIVPIQLRSERGGEHSGKEILRHFWGNQDEYTVAAVLVIAVTPPDSRVAEGLLQCLVQAVADGDLVPVGASLITESFDVDDDHALR